MVDKIQFMELKVQKMLSEYYKELNLIPRNNSRLAYQVQPRAAMMVAMTKEMPVVNVARSFGMNHATVLHHKRKHKANLEYWVGYKDNYDLARSLCDTWLKREKIQSAISRVNRRIKTLQGVAEQLNQRLTNEQLQVQNNED